MLDSETIALQNSLFLWIAFLTDFILAGERELSRMAAGA